MERSPCPHGAHLIAAYIQGRIVSTDFVINDGDVLSRPVQHPSSREQQVGVSLAFVALACRPYCGVLAAATHPR